MGSPNTKVTSFDVARLAGVSRAAVSRTFIPNASVSPETRENVLKAASELGYRVNYLARSLTNQRSDLVGVVVADLDNPFRAQQIEQIARALLARNLRPILLPTSVRAGAADLIGQVLQYAVSGVIVTSDAPPSSLCEECADRGVPIILINKGDDINLVDRVVSDNVAAGKSAAAYFIENGASRPAVMGAAHTSYSVRLRIEAFSDQCRSLGVAPEVIPISANDYPEGFDGAERLADLRIDALFCANDYLACGVIDRLGRYQRHTESPAIRIIGHDDIPQAAWNAYGLTTFLQPCDVQAELAVDLLTSRIEDPKIPSRVEFTPVTVIKRSTA
jgi:LacI family transcriptional regulator